MLLVFRVNDQLLKTGDRKVEHLGLTSARWQILGAIAVAPQPRTAPQLAQRLGVSRQGAQKQLNLLLKIGLVSAQANPKNQRSPFYLLTDEGAASYRAASEIQREWVEELIANLNPEQLDATRRLLKKLSSQLD
jgi:DNA-binding MarR family transcriptional regulator